MAACVAAAKEYVACQPHCKRPIQFILAYMIFAHLLVHPRIAPMIPCRNCAAAVNARYRASEDWQASAELCAPQCAHSLNCSPMTASAPIPQPGQTVPNLVLPPSALTLSVWSHQTGLPAAYTVTLVTFAWLVPDRAPEVPSNAAPYSGQPTNKRCI